MGFTVVFWILFSVGVLLLTAEACLFVVMYRQGLLEADVRGWHVVIYVAPALLGVMLSLGLLVEVDPWLYGVPLVFAIIVLLLVQASLLWSHIHTAEHERALAKFQRARMKQ